MQVRRLAEPRHLDIIAAAIGAVACVERLGQIADDVDDEAQCYSLVVCRRLAVAQRSAEPIEGGNRVSLRRRADLIMVSPAGIST